MKSSIHCTLLYLTFAGVILLTMVYLSPSHYQFESIVKIQNQVVTKQSNFDITVMSR